MPIKSKMIVYHIEHPANKVRGGSVVVIKDSIKHHEDVRWAVDIPNNKVKAK